MGIGFSHTNLSTPVPERSAILSFKEHQVRAKILVVSKGQGVVGVGLAECDNASPVDLGHKDRHRSHLHLEPLAIWTRTRYRLASVKREGARCRSSLALDSTLARQ